MEIDENRTNQKEWNSIKQNKTKKSRSDQNRNE